MKRLSDIIKLPTPEVVESIPQCKDLLNIYAGPIVNYPIGSPQFCVETLVTTAPINNFLKKLLSKIDFNLNYKIYKIQDFISDKVSSKEDKYVNLYVTKEEYYKLDEVIIDIANFYGYYVNHVEPYNGKYIICIYPKFQSMFLLRNEKYLVHITTKKNCEKILKQGFKPYSRQTKLDNHEKYNRKNNDDYNIYYHEDSVHFSVSSSLKDYLSEVWIKKFIKEYNQDLSCIIVSTANLKNISFGVDPNSNTNVLTSVYTKDNIGPDNIVKTIDIPLHSNIDKIINEILKSI